MKGSSVSVGTLLDRKGRRVFSIVPEASVYSAIEQMAGAGDRRAGGFRPRAFGRDPIGARLYTQSDSGRPVFARD